jgi:hypothetical protein
MPTTAHLGLNKKILTSKIRHENDDIFKNALSKKGFPTVPIKA